MITILMTISLIVYLTTIYGIKISYKDECDKKTKIIFDKCQKIKKEISEKRMKMINEMIEESKRREGVK